MMEDDDIREDTYEEMLAEKRHTQLVKLLSGLSNKEDNELKGIVSKNAELIKVFIDKVGEIVKPEIRELPTPTVTVNTDNKEVIKSFAEMGNSITTSLQNLQKCIEEKKPVDYEFTMQYEYGVLNKIIATVKK